MSFLVLLSYVSAPSSLLYHCVYFPQLVYISSGILGLKWYIRIYEDTAERNKKRKEFIPSADGNNYRIVKVSLK